ncbi:hypothetical protein EI94DRAFT_1660737 [Lactarius quietus]|nr:hypothetical protein EI94DRAFT_1660737 [Lactarius quietus]
MSSKAAAAAAAAHKLAEFKKDTSIHGLLASISFLVVLPIGVLVARYTRTFTNRWYNAHWIINLVLGLPLIATAWVMGRNAHELGRGGPMTPHGRLGVFIIGLYIAQLVLGLFIHYIKVPFPSFGHRPPQNFLHAVQGLAILGLSNYQIYDGLYHKSSFLADHVGQFAKRSWLGLIITFWALYTIGLIFLRRQYMQERRARKEKGQEKVQQSSYMMQMRSAY